MANAGFIITYRGADPGLPKRQFNNMKKACYGAIAQHWFEQYRPLHFRESAYSRYRFKARARDYVKRKRKRKGHNRPMVWSGESERLSRMARITSTNKGGKVAMSARKLNFRHPASVINMAEELRKVNKIEVKEIQKVFDKRLQEQFTRNRDERRVTIRT
jgi:hypothetical protein